MARWIQTAAALGVAILAACTPHPAAPTASSAPPPPAPFEVHATVRELMDAVVDPAADVVWGSVSTRLTLTGTQELQPRTPEEWASVRRGALTLIEATNLLVMPNRRIAAADAPAVSGELSPAAAQQALDGHREQFTGYALGLRAVAHQALDAIDARDPKRLFEIGAQLDAACESCHLVFWYPPAAAS